MSTATQSAGMTNAEYHAHPAISKSHLDAVAKSPRHYWARYIDPNRVPEPTTTAFAIGTAVHSAVLEPDLFAWDYVVAPEINRRTNDGKAQWEAFVAANASKTVLSAEDHALALAMQSAVRSHDVAGPLFESGEAERSVITTYPGAGASVKCRPDWLTTDARVIDLKTTDDASPEGFARSIWNFRYHVQAAWYMHLLESEYGERPEAFVFVAVEKKPPYAIGVYQLDEIALRRGLLTAERDLDMILTCRMDDHWPDYCTHVQTLQLPAWAK